MAEPIPANEDNWHLDKRVPIALIFAIAVQTIVIGIWVGSLQTRVTELETKAGRSLEVRDRVIRVESDIGHVRGSIERIEGILGRRLPEAP